MARDLRSVMILLLSATLVAALLAGTAFLACGQDGSRCVATQKFLNSPASSGGMEVDVMEGMASHVHVHGVPDKGTPAWKRWWQGTGERAQNSTVRDPIWGYIPEDRRNHQNIHCGELQIPVTENIAKGTWPIKEDSVRNRGALSCTDGMVNNGGTFHDCKSVDLLSFVPLNDFFGSSKANDVWGWTDPSNNREYAIIGLGDGTGFVDITDPTAPVVVAVLPTTTTSSTWRDIKVYKNRAYIVSEAWGHGMQVFDLTRLRGRTELPTEADEEDFRWNEVGSAHNVVINEETGRAYVVGAMNSWGYWRKCSAGLVIVDIREPEPRFEGCYSDDGYTHDAECVIYTGPDVEHQGKEICFAYNENSVTIVDVTRHSDGTGSWVDPKMLSRTPYENSHYTHQGWLDAKMEFLYMNDELDEQNMRDKRTRTFIFDVTDLDNAKYHDTFWHETEAIDHNNYIMNGYIYQANYCAGLRILKIKPDHGLEEVAYFDTEPQCNSAVFDGVWSVYPWFSSGTVVVSSIPRGLFVLRANHLPAGASA